MAAKSDCAPRSKDSLVCIGQNVRLSGSNLRMLADLFLYPDGTVCIAVRNSSGDVSEIAQFISRIGFPGLNMIASDYYYKVEGQALDLVDIMARHGHISFSQAADFRASVENGVSFPVIFFVGNAHRPG